MKKIVRWVGFTLAATLVWLACGFGYLVLSRHYGTLQEPVLQLGALFTFSALSALFAISFAIKFDTPGATGSPAARRPTARRWFTARRAQR